MHAPGERLLIKLWTSLADNGVGGMLRPWQIRRVGRAETMVEVERLVEVARAEMLVEQLKALPAPDNSASLTPLLIAPQDASPTAVLQREHVRLLRQEANVAGAILAAEEQLHDDPSPCSPDDVQEDWLHRWRDGAAGVSRDELQVLWGQLLAGELKAPGSFSLRTLDFVRNLSSQDAELIEIASRFVCEDMLMPWGQGAMTEAGLSLEKIIHLSNIGFIGPVSSSLKRGLDRVASGGMHAIVIYGDRVVLLERMEGKTPPRGYPSYTLTGVGVELMQLTSPERSSAYLNSICTGFLKAGLRVYVADLTSRGPGEKIGFRNLHEAGSPGD